LLAEELVVRRFGCAPDVVFLVVDLDFEPARLAGGTFPPSQLVGCGAPYRS